MTIYEALKGRLGREPTATELKSDVARIIAEGTAQARSSDAYHDKMRRKAAFINKFNKRTDELNKRI